MDFLRIRQKASERARAREEAARLGDSVPPGRVPEEPAVVDSVRPERGSEGPAAEGPAAEGPEVEGRPAPQEQEPGPSSAKENADPLDEFFWREDETAPRLPELVAASELPVPEPPPVRREWLTFRLGAEEYALEIEPRPPGVGSVSTEYIVGIGRERSRLVILLDAVALLGDAASTRAAGAAP